LWCFSLVPREQVLTFGAAMSGPFDKRDLRGETVALEIDGESVEAFIPWPSKSFGLAADRAIMFACSPKCQQALADLAASDEQDHQIRARKLEEWLSALSVAPHGRQTIH
jgi:hypothetical protein